VFDFGSLSSISSFVKNTNALLRFYFRPCGGSFVNLIDLSRRPIGIEFAGSEDTNNLKLGFDPSAAKPSSFFSSSIKNLGIK
jgi:hypothetical protein